jgi:tetratricopeptide (TPR) repeat protein
VNDRVDALYEASRIAFDRSDSAHEHQLLGEAAALSTAEPRSRIRVVGAQAWLALRGGELDAAERLAAHGLDLAQRFGGPADLQEVQGVLGKIAGARGDFATAERCLQQCVALAREIGDRASEATAIGNLGVTVHLRADEQDHAPDYEQAVRYYEQESSLYRLLGDRIGVAHSVLNTAQARLRLGDAEGAGAAAREGITVALEIGARRTAMMGLMVEADRLLVNDEAERGLLLLGAARTDPDADDLEEIERILSRAALDPITVEAQLAAGATLDVDDLLAELTTGSA